MSSFNACPDKAQAALVPVAAPLPPPPPPPDIDPENGSLIVDRGAGTGLGTLTIENGTDRSASVKLTEVTHPDRLVYELFIHKGSNATLPAIDPGTYELWYCFGRCWNEEKKRFTLDRDAWKADGSTEFAERTEQSAEGETRHYHHWTVSLHRVPGGTLHTNHRSAAEFDMLR